MNQKIVIITVILALFLAACTQGDTPAAEVIPTQETLQGAVDITFPMSGAIIYAETILLQGTASDIPEDGFQIQLITPDDTIVAEATVLADENGQWLVELVHGYTGDPSEVTIVAKPTNPDSTLDYDIESILLSTLDNRPEGTFGQILFPTAGTPVGGDSIPVSGRGSGFFEGTFILRLEDSEGELIIQMSVTIDNPNFLDDVLWEAELPRNDFIGNGIIRMVYQDMESGDAVTVDSVTVVVSTVAG